MQRLIIAAVSAVALVGCAHGSGARSSEEDEAPPSQVSTAAASVTGCSPIEARGHLLKFGVWRVSLCGRELDCIIATKASFIGLGPAVTPTCGETSASIERRAAR